MKKSDKDMRISKLCILSVVSLSFTIFCGSILSSSVVSADDSAVDNINITVPVSCSLSGIGTDSHNATLNNGTYSSNVGETTLEAFCNDKDGFSIYAIGYTDDTDGKNVLASSTLGSDYDIATGTATSGNSQWAMKLVTDSNATYPIELQNGFNAFHAVPDDYTLVAKRTAGTDIGASASGSTLTTTYQIYVSSTQPTDYYNGQVKYVMIHPNDKYKPLKDEIEVIYDGNGLVFSGGASTNRMVYGDDCVTMYEGLEPDVYKTDNVDSDGDIGSLVDTITELKPITVPGAEALKVVLSYNVGSGSDWSNGCIGITANYVDDLDYSYCYDGVYWDYYDWDLIAPSGSNTSTYIISGNTVTIDFEVWDNNGGDNFGYYALIYPLYETEQEGSEEFSVCSLLPISGEYEETTIWNGRWYTMLNGNIIWFNNENNILRYLRKERTSLSGTTLHLYSYNQYKIKYDGNNATAGNMNDCYTTVDTLFSDVKLTAPNFYRLNYGFAGWSVDPSIAINSSTKVYGPNETITGTDLFSSDNHEVTLYAVWVPTAGNLQNWSGCSGLEKGQVTALTDTRDGNTYAVAKLADNACWMIENLRLNTAGSDDDTKSQGFGGAFAGLAEPETTNFSFTAAANSLYYSGTPSGTASIDVGNPASPPEYRIPRYDNTNTNALSSSIVWNSSNIYGYGNIYNWSAAKASTAILSSVNASESANTSICPTGWMLPYGRNTGNGNTKRGFYYLIRQITDSSSSSVINQKLRSYPNNFVGGNNSILSYWSSTASGINYAYNLYIDSWQAVLESRLKYNGLVVRCVFGE